MYLQKYLVFRYSNNYEYIYKSFSYNRYVKIIELFNLNSDFLFKKKIEYMPENNLKVTLETFIIIFER